MKTANNKATTITERKKGIVVKLTAAKLSTNCHQVSVREILLIIQKPRKARGLSIFMVRLAGIEPAAPGLGIRCSIP